MIGLVDGIGRWDVGLETGTEDLQKRNAAHR